MTMLLAILLLLPTSIFAQSISGGPGVNISGGGRISNLGQLSGSLCSNGEVLQNNSGLTWECSVVTGSGSFTVLDLADDDANESLSITEIAVTGDTNSIFTEPSADKLLIDAGNSWPTADALTSNGSNCPAGQFPLGVDASGAVEGCTAATVGTSIDYFGS